MLQTERDPYRLIKIQQPHDYDGRLGAAQNCFHLKDDDCWIVNGWLFKADGNFLDKFFILETGSPNLLMGSYPGSDIDF